MNRRYIEDLAPGEYVLGVETISTSEYDPYDPTHLGATESSLGIPVRMVAKYGPSEGRDAGHWERAGQECHLVFTDELDAQSREKAMHFIEVKFDVTRRPLRRRQRQPVNDYAKHKQSK